MTLSVHKPVRVAKLRILIALLFSRGAVGMYYRWGVLECLPMRRKEMWLGTLHVGSSYYFFRGFISQARWYIPGCSLYVFLYSIVCLKYFMIEKNNL